MLELDFDSIRIETVSSIEREIVVHPVGHAERDYDHRAGIVMTWRDGLVSLATSRFFNDSGCYVTACLGSFPDRPFPKSKEEAIEVVKAVIRSFAAGLLAAYPAPAPSARAEEAQTCQAKEEITRLGKLALQLLREGEGGGAYFTQSLARAAYQAAGEEIPEYLKTEKD